MKKILFLSFVFYSTIIGVGFATGAEIMLYFTRYSKYGLIGLIVSCVIMSVGAMCCMKPLSRRQSIFCAVFAYIQYVAVLAGSSEICTFLFFRVFTDSGQTTVAYTYIKVCITFLFTLLSFLILLKGFKLLINIIGYITPVAATILVAFVLISSFFGTSIKGDVPEVSSSLIEVLFKALLYAGYNTLGACVILPRMKEYTFCLKNKIWGSVIGIILFFVSGCAVFFSQVLFGIDNLLSVKMPSLLIVSRMGTWAVIIYCLALIAIMCLSMFSGLCGTCGMVFKENSRNERRLGLILSLVAIPLSYIGFTGIIKYVYPIFGLLTPFVLLPEKCR